MNTYPLQLHYERDLSYKLITVVSTPLYRVSSLSACESASEAGLLTLSRVLAEIHEAVPWTLTMHDKACLLTMDKALQD